MVFVTKRFRKSFNYTKAIKMKKIKYILALVFLTLMVNAQVVNEKGLYVNEDGTLYTGTAVEQENGVKKSTFHIKDGVMDGEAQYFYASTGKLMETGMFEKGLKNGKWTRYNEAGIIVGLAQYSLGKKDGTWIVWDDNGKKRFEMNYSKGEKSGVWYNWDEAGQVVSTKDFGQAN